MAILKPEELKEKFDDPWIAPYESHYNGRWRYCRTY